MTTYYINRDAGKKAVIKNYGSRYFAKIGMNETKSYKTLQSAKNYLEKKGFKETDGNTYRAMK